VGKLINVASKLAFTFTCVAANGVTYSFQVFATNESEARKELTEALKQIINELGDFKAGTKAS
jgi:hypothetical protein